MALQSSKTVSQTGFPTRLVIEHAYRRCRLQAQVITGEMIDVAYDLLYLMLSQWATRGILLWTIEKKILSLYQGQAQLPCPAGTVDILNANLRTLTYQDIKVTQISPQQLQVSLNANLILLGGINQNGVTMTTIGSTWTGIALPYTIWGTSDPSHPMTMIGTVNPDTTNGPKTWQDFDAVPAYQYFLLTLIVPTITLSLQVVGGATVLYATDGDRGDVSQYFLNSTTFTLPGESQTFTVLGATYDQLNKFTKVLFSNATTKAVNMAGAQVGISPTLAIEPENLYICNNPYEITIARLNRDDYINLPNKSFQGRPLQYWYDRQRDIPIMTLWPAPDYGASLNQITIWRKRYVQDVGSLNDQLDIPQRWFDAVVYNLAFRLGEERPEVDINVLPILAARAQQSLTEAQAEERDNSPIYWTPNLRVYTR